MSNLIYKISVINELGEESFIYRKFKDFENFRNILRKQRPCIFIIPFFKKNLTQLFDEDYVSLRIKDLDKFFKFLTERKNLFNLKCVEIFFNSHY